MEISKMKLNIYRNIIKETLRIDEGTLDSYHNHVILAETMPELSKGHTKSVVIQKFNELTGYDFQESNTKDEIVRSVKEKYQKLAFHIKSLKSLLNGLDKSGYRVVTFELPYMGWIEFTDDLDLSYLIITGIKTNSKKKQEKDIKASSVEQKLFELEKKLGALIGDDFTVNMDSIELFLNLFEEYLTVYFGSYNLVPNIIEKQKFDEDMVLVNTLLNMFIYIVYAITGEKVFISSFEKFNEYFKAHKSLGQSTGQIFNDYWKRFISTEEDECVNQSMIDIIHSNFEKTLALKDPLLKKYREMEETLDWLEVTSAPAIYFLEAILKSLNLSASENMTFSDIKKQLSVKRQQVIDEYNKIEGTLNAISTKGFTSVTHRLPLICTTTVTYNVGYHRLILSGIRLNAKEKNVDDKNMSEEEIKTFHLEQELAKYINDDLSMDFANLSRVLELLEEYFELYIKSELDSERKGIIINALLSFGSYVYYCKTGKLFDFNDRRIIIKRINAHIDSGLTVSQAVYTYFRQCLNEVEMTVQESSTKIKEEDPISKYMKGNVVAIPCDLDKFEELLNSTDLPSNRKMELYAQMRNLLNRIFETEKAHKMRATIEEYLTVEDIEIYDRAKKVPYAQSQIANINATLEMLTGDLDETDKEYLIDDIISQINLLRTMLTSDREKNTEEEIPKLLYFTRDVVDSTGEKKSVAFIEDSIRELKKKDYKFVNQSLKKLLVHLTTNDRELKGSNLPCRIWYKGRDIKMFYTVIDGVIIVIDIVQGDEAYRRVNNLAKSKEFKAFIKGVKEGLAEGCKPDARTYTSSILEILSKDQKMMSLQ